MAIYQRDNKGNLVDSNGNIIGFDPPHQAAFDMDGQVVYPEDTVSLSNEVIEYQENSNGEMVVVENTGLDLIKKFDINNFINELEQNTDVALNTLLEMQSNATPLKKGGQQIGFIADVLLLAVRNVFNAAENTLFDVLSGKVSSFPDDNIYRINVSEFTPILPQKDRRYANGILQSATESIKEKNYLTFYPEEDKPEKKLVLPWAEVLYFTEASKVDAESKDDYIVFKPTKLLKMLLVSSQIMHGAHYSIGCSSQFVGYSRILFYYLRSKMNYKEFPTAIPGVFNVTIEELKFLLEFPDSFKAYDIKKNILNKAMKDYEDAGNTGFTFTYTDIKKGKSIIGFQIVIKKTDENGVVEKQVNAIEDKESIVSEDEVTIRSLLKAQALSDDEIQIIISKYKKNNRDITFMAQCIAVVSMRKDIESVGAYLATMMETGIANVSSGSEKKTFNNFDQRNYNMEEFEASILNSKL